MLALSTVVLFAVGAVAAAALIPLLARTYVDPTFRIWPTPRPGSWRSRVFWTLFRLLNMTVLALAATSALSAGAPGAFGVPTWLRFAALIGFAVAGIAYGYALLALGHANTYCSRGGLVTHGIYRWTRNPQYATIIPVYALLAVATDHALTTLLSAAMIAVYVLMALAEEPWLDAAYGSQYRRYRQHVPRFFNWRRVGALAHVVVVRGTTRRRRLINGYLWSHRAGSAGARPSTGVARRG